MTEHQLLVALSDAPQADVLERVVRAAADQAESLLGANIRVVQERLLRSHGDRAAIAKRLVADSALVVADVSATDPNVMWQLGFAHALGKLLVIVSADTDDAPVDVQPNVELLRWSPPDVGPLIARLADIIVTACDGSRLPDGYARICRSSDEASRLHQLQPPRP
jgi:hypothetical protein